MAFFISTLYCFLLFVLGCCFWSFRQTKKEKMNLLELGSLSWHHLSAVVNIDNASFEFPWGREEFKCCLKQDHVEAKVALLNGSVVGFVIYEKHDFDSSLLIKNFAVIIGKRRKGIGRFMLRGLIGKKWKRISLQVRETNLPAQLFFANCGFRAIKVLHKPYKNANDDAYEMDYVGISSFVPENRISDSYEGR